MKPKLDTSKSPTRKQLVKKIINYSEQLKEWHEFDVKWHGRPSSNRRSSRKNTRSPKTGSGVASVEEAYDDEDHRKMKMEKLKELMKVERDMAEYDGELNFKKQDIDKSYAGYPMFMQRRESPKTSRERLGSNDSISNLKRPLIEELKDTIEDAEKILPDELTEPTRIEESKLGDLCNSSCHQYVCKHRKEGEPIRIQSKDGSVVFEEKLYYLEIEHQTEYNESPLKERFDFHQRKSKEIRRLQYISTLNAKRKTPSPTTVRKPLYEPVREIIFKQGPKSGPQIITKEHSPRRERVYEPASKREPSFEYRERAEISIDSSKELIQDRAYLTSFKNLGVICRTADHSRPDTIDNGGIKPTLLDPNLFEVLKPNPEDYDDPAMQQSVEPDYYSDPGSPESEEEIQPNPKDRLDLPSFFVHSPEGMSREPSAYFEPLAVAKRQGPALMQSIIHGCYLRKVFLRPRNPPAALVIRKSLESTYILKPKKVNIPARLDPSPSRYHSTTDGTYVHHYKPTARLTPSPDKYSAKLEKVYVQSIKTTPRLTPSPDKFGAKIEKTYVHNIKQSPSLSPSPDRYSKQEDKSYIKKVYDRPRIDPSPERYQKQEDKSYAKKVYDRPRIDPSPERYQKQEDKTYLEKVYVRPRIDPSPDRYQKQEEKVYLHKVHNRPRIDPSPERYQKTEDKTYVQKVYTRPRLEASPDRYQKSEDNVYVDKVYTRPRIDPSPDFYHQAHDKSYIKKVYERPKVEPSPERYTKAEDRTYVQKVYVKPTIEPSPERYHQSQDKSYIKKVYERPRIDPSPERYQQNEDKSYIKRVYERPRIEPSPERFQQNEDKSSYIKRVYERPRIDPSPERFQQNEDKSYIKRVYERPRIEPSPERYQQSQDKTYIKPVYERPRIDPSPERYQQSHDKSYIKRVYERPRIEPSPERYQQSHDRTYVKPVYERPRIDPSPDRYQKVEDKSYVKRVYERPRIEPSPERYQQNQDKTYVKKVFARPRLEASPDRYQKAEDKTYVQKVYTRPRIDPSPERYHKTEDKSYIQKVHNRPRIEPSPNKIILTIDQAYIKKVYQRVRCDPSPKIERQDEQGYFKKIHNRPRITASPEKYQQTIEGGYFRKVFDKPRIHASPDKYIKTEERVYIEKVFKKARTPGAVRLEGKLESVYVKRVYLRKRITPLIIFCKLEGYYIRQTLLWESLGDNLSLDSADEISVNEVSKYSSGSSARESYSSNGDDFDHGLNKDDHPSDDDSVPVQEKPENMIQPPIEDQESHEGSETEISVKEESDEEETPEGMIRTKPDESFPVYVLAEDGYHIPARISSKEGFLIDMVKGKLEIKTGDSVTVYMADSKTASPTHYLDHYKTDDDVPTKEGSKDDESSPVLKPRRTFETTQDTVKKPELPRDPECDFIVTGEDRLPVVVVPRYIGPKDTNCTIYDPDDKKIDRAWFRLLYPSNEPWGFGIWASDGNIREVMARNANSDAVEIKRAPGAIEFEEVSSVSRKIIGGVPVTVFSLGGRRGGRLYLPENPARVLRSRLLDGEDGLAHTINGPIPEGTVLIEATPSGDLEIYVLVPPENRSTAFGEVPRYVLVDLDGQTEEDQRDYNDLKDRVRLLEEERGTSPKRQRSFSPNKKNIAIEQVDVKLVSLHGHEVQVDIKGQGMQPDEPEESMLDQFRSVQDAEELYYQLEYEDRLSSAPESTRKTKEIPLRDFTDSKKQVHPLPTNKTTGSALIPKPTSLVETKALDVYSSKQSSQTQPAKTGGAKIATKDSGQKPWQQSSKPTGTQQKAVTGQREAGKDKPVRQTGKETASVVKGKEKEKAKKDEEATPKKGYFSKHIGRSEKTAPAPVLKPFGYKQPLRGADIFDELIQPADITVSEIHSTEGVSRGNGNKRPTNGPAKIRIDMGGLDDNNRLQFVGVGRFSSGTGDRSRSPIRYTDQLKELNDRAARTVQLYWAYSKRKALTRERFRKKFSRARDTLGNERLFRKFLLHFVSLPGREDVDKALVNYVKVLNRSSAK